MYEHFVIITPYHKLGHRIGWHKVLDNDKDYEEVNDVLEKVIKKVGDLKVSSHVISTNSRNVQSIKDKDNFFHDVAFFEDEFQFIDMYKNEIELTAGDVAKFILSVGENITHLKLQKLLYLCYEDFMKLTGTSLFKDKIYAYKYGPVVKSVYDMYSDKGYSKLDFKEDDSVFLSKIDMLIKPSYSRILFSEAGSGALKSILDTLEKFIEFSASDLVDYTHQNGTAWSKVYKENIFNIEITDEVIEQSLSY